MRKKSVGRAAPFCIAENSRRRSQDSSGRAAATMVRAHASRYDSSELFSYLRSDFFERDRLSKFVVALLSHDRGIKAKAREVIPEQRVEKFIVVIRC